MQATATTSRPVRPSAQAQPTSTPPAPTHPAIVGYVLWIIGFTGAHRFYYGKPISGIIWLFTFGLIGIGWFIDLFLIPSACR